MDKNKRKLLDIFEDDQFGILNVKEQCSPAISEEERLVESYKEILDFYMQNNREPQLEKDITETLLYYRLKGIRENKSKLNLLIKYDTYNLLTNNIENEVKSIDDILNNDYLGILDSETEEIFNLKHIPKKTTMPRYVASRKTCNDFSDYEGIFKQCQSDLKHGKRKLNPFKNEQQIDKGYFFVLKGILLYVADIGERKLKNGKINARLRCIFENGTESDMLLRSLSAELYKNGRRVTEHEERILDKFNNIYVEDKEAGYIYILKSESNNEKIRTINNLYKIGFSTIKVEDRIKNAEQEPTYLMGNVSIVSVFKCYNMNPQKFEFLLHNFFGNTCLNVDVFDKAGKRHTPREWFIVPLDVIEEAIRFIISGEIIDYKYDYSRQIIVGK